MRILITNDDGIDAPGLVVCEEIARDLAGPDGEVWVFAPTVEQSGVGHALSYVDPLRVIERGHRRYSVSGTPADCVILALDYYMQGHWPDLVLSGVNKGHNIAEDAIYSGTVGAAMEGAMHGVRSIAMSQYYRKLDDAPADMFASARAHGTATIRHCLGLRWEKDVFYNINFPAVAPERVKGPVLAAQGRRKNGAFAPKRQISPNGKEHFWITHLADSSSCEPGSDARLMLDGHITLTPMSHELTRRDLL